MDAALEEMTMLLRGAIGEHLRILREMDAEILAPHSSAGIIETIS